LESDKGAVRWQVEPEPQEPLWKLMIEAMKDPTLIFLTVAAFISLFIGVRPP
jgi:hypothetical protein